jgi:hypothetical protein
MAHTILVDCQFSQRQFQDNYPIISVSNRKKQKNIVYYKKQSIIRGHYPQILYPAYVKKPSSVLKLSDIIGK